MIRSAGVYETVSTSEETLNSFVPAPLLPHDPPLAFDASIGNPLCETKTAGVRHSRSLQIPECTSAVFLEQPVQEMKKGAAISGTACSRNCHK